MQSVGSVRYVLDTENHCRRTAVDLIYRGQIICRLLKVYKRIMSLPLLHRKLAICWCLAAASPAILSPTVLLAQENLTPQGAEYAIVGALAGDQVRPQSAVSQTGGYLVWQDNAITTLGLRIRAVHLGSSLAADGLPFVISSAASSKTAGEQEKPQVSLLSSDGAVFVWQGGKKGAQQIFARFVNPDGSFISKADIRVSTHTKNNQTDPTVATLADGSVIVVWSSFGQDGSMQGVFAQRFSATGGRIGGEFQVNQFTFNNQRSPAVAAVASGGFVVAWVSELQRAAASVEIYARIFDSAGNGSAEFPVSVTTSNACANPAVAGSPQGGFGVAWSQNDNVLLAFGDGFGGVPVSGVATSKSTNSWDIFGCVFDVNGTATNLPVRLNTRTYGDQYAPKISALADAYLAVWTSLGQDGSWEGVFGQALADDESFIGSELRVNTTTVSRQIQPAVSADGSTRLLVTWSSFVPSGDFDLFAQQYQLTGP